MLLFSLILIINIIPRYINTIKIKLVQLREIRESHPVNRNKRNHTWRVRIPPNWIERSGGYSRETVDKEGNQRIGGKIRKQRIPIINRSPVEKWMESKTWGRKERRKKRGNGNTVPLFQRLGIWGKKWRSDA